jgi:hypothetical protein
VARGTRARLGHGNGGGGDLDPAGARIVRHLQGLAPSLAWFVPDFWAEELERRALPCTWPADLDLSSAPPLVRTLAARGAWLEQEAIVLDPRLPLAIVQYSQNDSRGAPPHG